LATKASPNRSEQECTNCVTTEIFVVLAILSANLLHLPRRGPTSFERRFLEEFEKWLPVLVEPAFSYFEFVLQLNRSVRRVVSLQLHVSTPHVEMVADFLVLLLPIFLLTSPGAIQGGLAHNAVLKLDILRFSGFAGDAAPEHGHGHDCCWSEVTVVVLYNAVCVDAANSK
jgi:hypothetical protein